MGAKRRVGWAKAIADMLRGNSNSSSTSSQNTERTVPFFEESKSFLKCYTGLVFRPKVKKAVPDLRYFENFPLSRFAKFRILPNLTGRRARGPF